MSSKIILIAFGVVVALAVFANAEQEENSLSEDVAFSRLVREADAGKGRKNNKRAGKKVRQNKKRAGKKGRQNKKRQNKKRQNKKRQNKKRQNKKRQNKKRGGKNKKQRMSGRAVDAKCVSQLTLAMRRWKDVATNYKRQSARITDNKKKGSNKSGKKGLFAPVANKLVSVGGGNKSALECGGQASGSGAEKITKLAKDLFDCEKSVNASCNPDNFPKPNDTLITKCDTLVADFEKEADKCMKLSKDEAKAVEGCACWTSDTAKKLTEDVNECKVKDDMDKIKAQLKKCTQAFGACRKLEDTAVETLSACSADPSKLAKKAAALSKNKKALEEAKKKIAALKAAASAGRRVIRAPATDCAGIIALVKELVTVVGENPSSPKVAELGDDVAKSTGTCSAADVAMLDEIESSLEEAAAAVDSALEAAQADLEAATGSTASAAALEAAETADSATTAAASAGASEGASAGASEGASAGASEGASAGASEGASAAPSEGASAGASEGASAGASEGASAGASEGASGGASEGASGGASEGASGGASSTARVMQHKNSNKFFKKLIKKVIA